MCFSRFDLAAPFAVVTPSMFVVVAVVADSAQLQMISEHLDSLNIASDKLVTQTRFFATKAEHLRAPFWQRQNSLLLSNTYAASLARC